MVIYQWFRIDDLIESGTNNLLLCAGKTMYPAENLVKRRLWESQRRWSLRGLDLKDLEQVEVKSF